MANPELIKEMLTGLVYHNNEMFYAAVLLMAANEAKSNNRKLAIEIRDLVDMVQKKIDKEKGYFTIIKPKKKLNDLILDAKIIEQAQGIIKEYKNMELLKKYKLKPVSKIIINGPAYCGQDILVEAIAHELGRELYIIKDARYLEDKKELSKSFDFMMGTIRSNTVPPKVIYIPEKSDLFYSRSEEFKEIETENMIILAFGAMDKLILSCLRHFDCMIELDVPSKDVIQKIIKKKLKNHELKFNYDYFIDKLVGLDFMAIDMVCAALLKRVLINKNILSNEVDEIIEYVDMIVHY